MQNISAQSFEKYWLSFSDLPNDDLLNLRDSFAIEQPHLYDYIFTTGGEEALSESARAILVYMSLALWDFIKRLTDNEQLIVEKKELLIIEKNNTQLFLPLENSESFQMSLIQILQTYPAKDIFIYIGQIISSRELGREDRSITAEQRGWLILYLKVVLDALVLCQVNF